MPKNKNPIMRIERPCYLLENDEKSGQAELTLYGEIVKERPFDYAQNKPDENFYIVEKEIIEDLSTLSGCKSLNLRINSLGGDAVVSLTVHNKLREMAKNGCKISCIVEGAAMSGGSIIMCAADTVKAARSSLIMIHKTSSWFCSRMNADDMKREAERLEHYDKAVLECYKRKSSCNEDELLQLMSDTCYMTGAEAFEKGFVDEILEDEVKISACAYDNTLLVNGCKLPLGGFPAPPNIPVISEPRLDINTKNPDKTETSVGENPKNGGKTMAKNLSELVKENPELAAAIREELSAQISKEADDRANTAATAMINAERERMAAIDEFKGVFDDDIINAAKYGDTACSVQEMCFRAAEKAKKSGAAFMSDVKTDAQSSGLDDVGTVSGEPETPKTGNADVKERSLAFMDEYLKGKAWE